MFSQPRLKSGEKENTIAGARCKVFFYNSQGGKIMAAQTGAIKLPVAVLIQQAEDLKVICEKDRERLIAAGFKWKEYQELLKGMDASKKLETSWKIYRQDYKGRTEALCITTRECMKLRAELWEHLDFYYRRNEMPRAVPGVSRKRSRADVAQDLMDLSALYEKAIQGTPEAMKNKHLPAEGRRMSGILLKSIAKHANDRPSISDLKKKRDEAILSLYKMMNSIRTAGRFAFRDDKDRAKAYANNYFQ
jgi:hypothetical protein